MSSGGIRDYPGGNRLSLGNLFLESIIGLKLR